MDKQSKIYKQLTVKYDNCVEDVKKKQIGKKKKYDGTSTVNPYAICSKVKYSKKPNEREVYFA